MSYIKEQYDNVRLVSHGAGLDGYDTLEYRDGDQWIVSARFDESDDYKCANESRALSALLRKYPNAKRPTKFVARVRNNAFRKDRSETHEFATRDEAIAFILANRDFAFDEVLI
jgi:hypothetical protein